MSMSVHDKGISKKHVKQGDAKLQPEDSRINLSLEQE